MEAYKVKYGTKVKVTDTDVRTPPDAHQVNKGDVVTILNLDGMYTNAIDSYGNKIYIAAWTEVELLKQ